MPTLIKLKICKPKLKKKGLKCVNTDFQYFQLKKGGGEKRKVAVTVTSVQCQTDKW